MHLDAGYDYRPCREELAERGLDWSISQRGTPVQVGRRWVVEAANSWLNDFGCLRRCTERCEAVAQAYLDLAVAVVTVPCSDPGRVEQLPLGRSTEVRANPLTYRRTA